VTHLLGGHRGLVIGVSGENSIGYAVARRFVELGAHAVVTCRPARQPVCAPLVERLGVHTVPMEANDDDSVRRAVATAQAILGGLDFVVHTLVSVRPGVLTRPLLELTRRDFHDTMDSSCYSLLAVVREAAPALGASAHGRVVTLTSSANRVLPSYHAVAMAKSALEAQLLHLSAELGPRGILCNGVAFSLVATDGAKQSVGGDNALATTQRIAKRAFTRTTVSAEQVANTAAFFASSLCQNITGEITTVDGGFARVYL